MQKINSRLGINILYHVTKVICKQPHPGFELVLAIPFPLTITIMLDLDVVLFRLIPEFNHPKHKRKV